MRVQSAALKKAGTRAMGRSTSASSGAGVGRPRRASLTLAERTGSAGRAARPGSAGVRQKKVGLLRDQY